MRPLHSLAVSLLAAGMALPLSSAAFANIVISIDKSTQRMSVAVDGVQRYEWPVSTGRPGYETPNGEFKPNRMDANHFSQEWDNAPMPHSIFFDTHGHAIHGFFDTPHLGMAVSHGCVRLSPANATTLFALVKTEGMANTSVVVTGKTPGGNGQEMARRNPDQETVYSSSPSAAPGAAPQGEPGYAQPSYGQPAPYPPPQAYGQQPYYGQQPGYGRPPSYNQSANPSTFPPQPPPVYGRPAYNQPYGGQAYQQPYPGQNYPGQGYYAQQPYGDPGYQQQPRGLFTPY